MQRMTRGLCKFTANQRFAGGSVAGKASCDIYRMTKKRYIAEQTLCGLDGPDKNWSAMDANADGDVTLGERPDQYPRRTPGLFLMVLPNKTRWPAGNNAIAIERHEEA